jgi:hypothetical protein
VVQSSPLEALEPRVVFVVGDGVLPLLGEPDEVVAYLVPVGL